MKTAKAVQVKLPALDEFHEYMATAHCSWGRAKTIGAAKKILAGHIGAQRARDARVRVVPKGAQITNDGLTIQWKRENHPQSLMGKCICTD